MESDCMEDHKQQLEENARVVHLAGGELEFHQPCPFCAHPEWRVYTYAMMSIAVLDECVCEQCGRSGKYVQHGVNGSKYSELIQTGGKDQEDWFEPKARVQL